jgi:hypothetical protein
MDLHAVPADDYTSEDWTQYAACVGLTDLFFPSENEDRNGRQYGRSLYHNARPVCMACPVRVHCLERALTEGDVDYGMFGGMSPGERRALVRNRTSDAARQLWEAMR